MTYERLFQLIADIEEEIDELETANDLSAEEGNELMRHVVDLRTEAQDIARRQA